MALDLTALDAPSPAEATGHALKVPREMVVEDPDQPRQEFDAAKLTELAEDIKRRGILQPIIVRPLNDAGQYVIRYGARRFRAGTEAGLTELPVVIDDDERLFDAYSQVSENKHREDLTPKEMAQFINRRLQEKESKASIARNLGVQAPVVTWHLALIDPPAFIDELYISGRCRSPEYLYRVRTMHAKAPELVERRVAEAESIGRAFLDELAEEIDPKKQPAPESSNAGSGGAVSDPLASELARQERADAALTPDESRSEKKTASASVDTTPVDPEALAKVRYRTILVRHDERPALLVLTRRASAPGLGWIKYSDDGNEVEIDLSQAKIDSLVE